MIHIKHKNYILISDCRQTIDRQAAGRR